MIQKHALNVLCEGSPENYNKDGERSESFNNFPEPTESTQSTLNMFLGRRPVKLQ